MQQLALRRAAAKRSLVHDDPGWVRGVRKTDRMVRTAKRSFRGLTLQAVLADWHGNRRAFRQSTLDYMKNPGGIRL